MWPQALAERRLAPLGRALSTLAGEGVVLVRRLATGLVAAYLLSAVVARFSEAVGAVRCGCAAGCWCHQPALGIFRWVFPWWHRPCHG